MSQFKLLTRNNPKILKGNAQGYLTFILHLAPSDLSGHQVCPKASAGCRAACLNTAGRGGIFKTGETSNTIQRARIRKTRAFFADRDAFMGELATEIRKAIRNAEKHGMTAVFRLNGTSDIAWEKQRVTVDGTEYRSIMHAFPLVQFYDYTKIIQRVERAAVADTWPSNYALTFSRADGNEHDVSRAIAVGANVAAVFAGALPDTWQGVPVIVGDESDLRFLDRKGTIVGLTAKGKARRDASGFVIA